MTIARRELVSTETTPYYHLIGRCVRRGFLCGFDAYSGNNYEHRRQWVVDRLAQLAEIFALEILAYAVMSNHYQLFIRLRPEWTDDLSDCEVIERWSRLYGLPSPLALHRRSEVPPEQQETARQLIEIRRQRLASVSWFMKCLNEFIARRANKEDECNGAFWEGRFKSRALLNERALLSCMAYVDLNPMRAKMAKSPDSSDYTSVQARIRRRRPVRLTPFQDEAPNAQKSTTIPASLGDYLQLVDLSGRQRSDKPQDTMDDVLVPILNRLGMDPQSWRRAVQVHKSPYHVLGTPDQVREVAKRLARKWFRGVGSMGVFAKS